MEYPESTILAARKKGYKDVSKYVAACKRYRDKRKENKDYIQKQKDYKKSKRVDSDPWYNPTDAWVRSIKKLYGITEEEYLEMYESQGGVCKICGMAETSTHRKVVKRLAVDHCHTTGKIRGLLCASCSTGLGLFRDTPDLLIKASNYLKEN